MKKIFLFGIICLLSGKIFAQEGTVRWRVNFSYTSTYDANSKSAGGESTHKTTMNGTVTMLIESAPAFDKGHQIINTEFDKIISFAVSGAVSENIYDITKDPVGILETRKDEYHGIADQSEQGIEFEYDPSAEGARYINAGIRFNRKGGYTIHRYARVGEPDRSTYYADDNEDFGTYTASIGSSTDSIQVVKNGYIIDGGSTEHTDGSSSGDLKSTRSIHYHVTILRESDITAIIEPIVNADTYHKWLPEGPDPEKHGSTGNNVTFRVYLVDKKKPGQKITSGIDKVRYYFDQVSNVPGYAMNYPRENIDTKADLQLGKVTDKPDTTKEKRSITIVTKDDPNHQVKVESFDYGAYGKLKATVTLSTGEEIEATDISKKSFITIPYSSKEGSAIADYWKENEKATKLDDTDDEENQDNLGDNKYKGDGYSLYEEYRGFIEDGKHIRTSALKKDVMVCDKVKESLQAASDALPANDIRKKSLPGRSQDGINMFAEITGFVTHSKFKEEEFGMDLGKNIYAGHAELDTLALPSFTASKILNFNTWDEKFLHNQSGILLLPSPKKLGYAAAYATRTTLPRPIGAHYCLVITSDFSPDSKGYNQVNGTANDDGSVNVDPNATGLIISDDYAITVAHEMLHYCNVQHHGTTEIAAKEKNYQFWRGENITGGDPKVIYIIDPDNAKDKGKVVDLRLDDKAGTPLLATDKIYDKYKYHTWSVGLPQGNCSGVEECMMRYQTASVFKKGETYYLTIAAYNGKTSELSGLQLCDSPIGTGVNAKDHLPRSRYGDASPGLGNCKAQVCVNDKYH